MNLRKAFWFSAVCFVLGAVNMGFAAVPTLMNYQGVLLNSGGQPITTQVTVVFTIYDASTLGNNLWDEPRNVTPDAQGRFNINLGQVDNLTDAVFTGPDRWLGIRVGTDLELTPRTRLTSAPYAYRISTVDGSTGGVISGDVAISGGNVELDLSSATSGNILKGGTPFIHNFGDYNTFIGSNAGNLTMTGVANTGSGLGALQNNTTGNFNTASGVWALTANTTGVNNTASGYQALYNNTIGYNNTATGREALWGNTTGNFNTAIGLGALVYNTTGNNNTASGNAALWSNNTGSANTATGNAALWSNNTGSANTASGSNALGNNTTGDSSTASGAGALQSNTTGYYNTANGAGALRDNTTGICNTASGMRALQLNTTGNGNTASGSFALLSNITGYRNTAAGREALYSNTDGDSNTACGANALYSNTTSWLNTAIGYQADVDTGNLTNATAIGAYAIVDDNNKIRLGNTAVTVLECQVGLTVVSDSNQKENFRPVDGDEVLRKIRGLNLTSWNMIGHDPQQFRHYGPVAQEFFAAFGHDGVGTSGTPTTINSGDMAGIMMIAIQALEKRTAEVATIKAENEDMKKQVEQLQALVQKLLDEKK